jgi:hypothetical protein
MQVIAASIANKRCMELSVTQGGEPYNTHIDAYRQPVP